MNITHSAMEQMQLEAVQQNGLVIQYIANPSEQAKLVAVQHHSLNVFAIKDPTEELLKMAERQWINL